jgi:prevent-host-death family protein
MSEKRIPWSVSATEAQNNFGRVLGRVAEEGVVYITRYDRPQAVVISVDRYEALVGDSDPGLADLAREFDAMLEAMQTPEAAAAGDTLFAMDGEALGAAAVRGAARKKTRP